MNIIPQDKPATSVEPTLSDKYLPELLEAAVADYIDQLKNTPAVCQTIEQQARLASLVADGKKLIKVIVDERTKITKPLDEQKAYWIGKERALTNQLEQAMLQLKLVVDDYNQQQMRQRLLDEATQRQLQQQEIEQKGEANWLTVTPAATPKPKGVRQVWTHRVIDIKLVPVEFLTVDAARIKEAINDGARAISGIDIYQEAVTTYRS
jgi:hypothetical protein